MLLKTKVCLVASIVFLASCDYNKTSSEKAYKISGFSPIEVMIPDWTERREVGFLTHLINENGSKTTTTHGNSFECENTDNLPFALKEVSGNELTFTKLPYSNIWDSSPTVRLPEGLKQFVEKIKEEREGVEAAIHLDWPARDFLEFQDGWLVAYGAGEWGGELIWVERDGAYRTIISNNTNDLLEHNGIIYAAHGVDHLFTSSESISVLKKDGSRFNQITIPTPSAVHKLDSLGDNVVGLLNSGIVYLNEAGGVHFRRFSYRERLGFMSEKIGFLPSGDVYISGSNIIGIYNNLPHVAEPKLYVPSDCTVIFEKELKVSPK